MVSRMTVLAIDAGTTGVTALVVGDDTRGRRGYREFPQHFPQPGWVEHDPEEIWYATLRRRAAEALAAARSRAADGHRVGITNQRETVVLWDRATWPRRARRSSGRTAAPPMLRQLRAAGHEPGSRAADRAAPRPVLLGTKLAWLPTTSLDVWRAPATG